MANDCEYLLAGLDLLPLGSHLPTGIWIELHNVHHVKDFILSNWQSCRVITINIYVSQLAGFKVVNSIQVQAFARFRISALRPSRDVALQLHRPSSHLSAHG